MSVLHSLFDGVPDTVIWGPEVSGEYSARSGYKWLSKLDTLTPHTSWTWIWKAKAPENIKFMIWLICHNSLPTRSTLTQRGLPLDASCPWCNAAEETIAHSLCDCPTSNDIWMGVGLAKYGAASMSTPLLDWLAAGVSSAGPLFPAASGC
ncbi:Reverse transcriptase zinc-binding domain [Sesbania bispinosa]|nr:Reverse transcriptase zinc-binding domain [Sesbania bispinosa]